MTDKTHKAEYGSPDRPLKIGNLEIPCYVLEDGTRVLVQRGMIKALGMSYGGGRETGGADRLTQFTGGKALKPFISAEIVARTENPTKFKLPNGTTAYGYEATLLPDICNAVLEAREKGVLQKQQEHIGKQCELLIRGFAVIGIIALIDEATGYQEVRDQEALQQILDRYLTDEWAKWTKTFPDAFYKNLFRLKNMPYPPASGHKPSYIGHWTNDLIYKRLAPGVLKALRDKNPRLATGSRGHKHHQHLTSDYGTPELKKLLDNEIFLMEGCRTWTDFYRKLNRSAPRYGDTIPLDLPNPADSTDEGDG